MNRTIDNFLSNLDSQVQVFIVSQIQDLVESDDPSSVFLYDDSNEEFENKSIKDVLKALKYTDDPLEFKVNQEIFGFNPDSRFKDVIDFWLNNVLGDAKEEFCIFLDELDAITIKLNDVGGKLPYDAQFLLKVFDASSKMTYNDFFEIRKLLVKRLNDVIESHQSSLDDEIDSLFEDINFDKDFDENEVKMTKSDFEDISEEDIIAALRELSSSME